MLTKRILLLSVLAVFFTTVALAPFTVSKKAEKPEIDNAYTEDNGFEAEKNDSGKVHYGNNGDHVVHGGGFNVAIPDDILTELPAIGDIIIDITTPQLGLKPSKPESELPYASDVGVFVPYAVPLSIEEQKFIEEVAARFNVHEELVYGVMWAESRYDRNAIGKNNRYLGIMQVSKSNLSILKTYCGVTNLMDFRQNVIAGCYFLGHYADLYDHNMNIMLLYYHGGYKYANPLIAQGIYEDSYTAEVFAEMNRILEIRKQTAAEMGVRIKGWLYEY